MTFESQTRINIVLLSRDFPAELPTMNTVISNSGTSDTGR